MSFRCAVCGKAAPPKVSPVLDIDEEKKDYFSIDEKGALVLVGSGMTIIRENKVCPDCTGIPIKVEAKPDHSVMRIYINGYAFRHVSKCEGVKKIRTRKGEADRTIPCPECVAIMATIATWGPHALSFALEQPMAPPFHRSNAKASLLEMAAESLNRRADDNSKRATRDVMAGYNIMAPYAAKSARR